MENSNHVRQQRRREHGTAVRRRKRNFEMPCNGPTERANLRYTVRGTESELPTARAWIVWSEREAGVQLPSSEAGHLLDTVVCVCAAAAMFGASMLAFRWAGGSLPGLATVIISLAQMIGVGTLAIWTVRRRG